MKFAGFHFIDAREHIGIPVDRVDAIALARGNERQVNSYGSGTIIGAGKETVFSYENPAFDRPLGRVLLSMPISGSFRNRVSAIQCFRV